MRLHLLPLGLLALVSCRSSASEEAPELPAPAPAPLEDPLPAIDSGPQIEASAPRPAAPQDLQETAEVVQRRRDAQRSLASDYVERGQQELERADLRAALESFSTALSLNPSDEGAREGLRRVRSLLGDEFATAGEAFADETQRLMVKRAQSLIEVEEHVAKGDLALREGKYAEAVQEYRLAEMVLRYNPLIASGSLDERLVRNKLAEAERLRAQSLVEAEESERQAALEVQRRAELEERERRESRLREFYDLANKAFIADRFGEAESWCRQILIEDPGNESAQYLLRVARESRHHRTNELNRKHYREQWLRTFEELDTMNVPQTDALKFHLERWREVSQRQPLSHGQLDPSGRDQEREEVLARLEAVRFSPNFGGPDDEGTPLESVASYLQQLTGVNFWISNAVRDDLDEEETNIILRLPERSVRKVLDIVADTREELRWKIEDGVVMFVTRDEMVGGQILVTYGVQDLIHPIPDYAGRDINVSPSGGIVPPDEDFEEREANVVNTSLLEDLIRNNIQPDSWDADPANSIRINDNGIMVVNQVPEVQEKIGSLLDDLREATGIMVDIQARFMKVEDSFLEDIGIDFRGLGAPGLGSSNDFNDFGDASFQDDLNTGPGSDNSLGAFYDEGADGDVKARVEDLYDTQLGEDDFRGSGGLSFQWTYLNDMELQLILRAVSKSERIELVTAPRILVHNTARANISVLNQVAYVQDFDVEIAQAASIADPIIQVIQDGVILDVRPVVSADRRFITLELRPTIANLTRPIEERVTTLGSQNSVTIQLPEVEIQRVRTSIPIPDGGTVLLGGTKSSKKQDQKSGVPILNQIPLLSAFFERKGKFISNRKLLILLRANIVIPEEVAPTNAEMGLTE